MKKQYCIYCLEEPIPGEGYPFPCQRSETGSHRVMRQGDVRYRVKGPDGYVYLFHSVPDGYELVEKIIY